jgi:hypothetical protein
MDVRGMEIGLVRSAGLLRSMPSGLRTDQSLITERAGTNGGQQADRREWQAHSWQTADKPGAAAEAKQGTKGPGTVSQ